MNSDRGPVKERTKDNLEELFSHKMKIDLSKTCQVGVNVDAPMVDKYKMMPSIIRIAERNVFAGQLFAGEIFEWWKSLHFTDKLIDHIDSLRMDKIGLLKSVDITLQQKYMK
mmetsp:Transcript_33882/g.52218  ORF Transcript_33882/g.52218 Transcript_33882/m.52218 type:complete len:112 (+) Transcript_33882:1712-2047(+)